MCAGVRYGLFVRKKKIRDGVRILSYEMESRSLAAVERKEESRGEDRRKLSGGDIIRYLITL